MNFEAEPTEQELRERLAFLEDRLDHFREMLAWRNGERVELLRKVERLERELRKTRLDRLVDDYERIAAETAPELLPVVHAHRDLEFQRQIMRLAANFKPSVRPKGWKERLQLVGKLRDVDNNE